MKTSLRSAKDKSSPCLSYDPTTIRMSEEQNEGEDTKTVGIMDPYHSQHLVHSSLNRSGRIVEEETGCFLLLHMLPQAQPETTSTVQLQPALGSLLKCGTEIDNPPLFDFLKQEYLISNEHDLKKYLDDNIELYKFLISKKEEINNVARNASITLELYTFIDGGDEVVFITIDLHDSSTKEADDIEDKLIESIIVPNSNLLNGRIAFSI